MEKVFQLLDVTYEIVSGAPAILIYARDEAGSRILLIHDRFRPYFYAVLEPGADPGRVAGEIKRLSEPGSPVLEVKEEDLRYIGRPVKALKITTLIPASVRRYRERVARIPGVREVLEADIRFAMRFMIDHNLYPMRWYRAEVEEHRGLPGYRVEGFYRVIGEIREEPGLASADPLEGLRILAFDIEAYNPRGSPEPARDPVILIGVMEKGGEPEILEAEDHRDRALIYRFTRRILDSDPDIVVGYNQNRFDWPYLMERSKINGVKLDVTRKAGAQPQTSAYGHISLHGRLNVDLYDYAEEISGVKIKSLEEVADYLGVMPKEKRTLIDWWRIAEYWDDPAKRRELINYTRDDVVSTMLLAEKLLPFGSQLSQVSGLPLDQVMAASVGFRLEWRLIREAKKLGELVPNRVERGEETYAGAVVLRPKPGIHEWIAVLDFSSMYPNIMIKYNVGPDTLLRPGEDPGPEGAYVAPDVGHRFRREPPGFFKRVLEKFLSMRRMVKEEMAKAPKGSPLYRLLDERQRAIKLLANACYGYLGWPGARWYCRECAESVTAWGRHTILSAIDLARSLGLRVIYGDTDSLFVDYKEDKVREFMRLVEERLGFEIKLEKVYRRVFFTEAKKRYIGLTIDGKIDVVGFEAVRGDWSELAKETQIRVAEIVLRTGDVEKAVEYVRSIVEDLRRGRVDPKKLVIWKTLTRRPSQYEAEQPHVHAARIMMRAGYRVEPGMKIGFIITRGSGPLSRRAKPYFMVDPGEIDYNYYIEKQVIQAALRILGYLGVTEKRLKTGRRQTSLMDYLG